MLSAGSGHHSNTLMMMTSRMKRSQDVVDPCHHHTHSLTHSLAHFGAHGKYVMLEDRLAPSAPPLSAVP